MSRSTLCTNLRDARPTPLTLNAKRLREVFEQIDAQSCPEHFNFHMHTLHSDGKLSPKEVMLQALDIGLKGLAITDHNGLDGYWAAYNWLQDQCWQKGNGCQFPQLWTGIEINAALCGTEVHLLGYGFDPDAPVLRPYLQGRATKGAAYEAEAVIRSLKSAGGLAVLAHPARYRKPADELLEAAVECGIDGVETYYAYDNPFPWRPTPGKVEQVKVLAERYGLFSTCGTDTHGTSLLRRV